MLFSVSSFSAKSMNEELELQPPRRQRNQVDRRFCFQLKRNDLWCTRPIHSHNREARAQSLSCTIRNRNTEPPREFSFADGQPEERTMPVFILWAVPAVFVLGGVAYMIVK